MIIQGALRLIRKALDSSGACNKYLAVLQAYITRDTVKTQKALRETATFPTANGSTWATGSACIELPLQGRRPESLLVFRHKGTEQGHRQGRQFLGLRDVGTHGKVVVVIFLNDIQYLAVQDQCRPAVQHVRMMTPIDACSSATQMQGPENELRFTRLGACWQSGHVGLSRQETHRLLYCRAQMQARTFIFHADS